MIFKSPRPRNDAGNHLLESIPDSVSDSRSQADGPSPGLETLEPRLLLSGSIGAQFVQVDNASALTGYNTYDLQVTADTDWTAASLLIELSRGSIYQDSAGTDRAPNPVLLGAFPGLEFDTYVSANGNSLSILDRATEIGGDALQFDTREIDITWFDLAKNDTGTVVIARVTLSDDAVGTMAMKVFGDSVASFKTASTFTAGDLINATPATPRPPSRPPPPPPPTGPIEFGARFVEVDNSSALTGYRTYDLQVSTMTDWTITGLVIDLRRGSIYQDASQFPVEGFWESGPEAIIASPSLEFDTYISANGNSPSVVGLAAGIGGKKLQFDTKRIDITWFDTAINDVGNIIIGRFTLSDNAAGNLSMKVFSGDAGSVKVKGAFSRGDLTTLAPPAPLPPPPKPIVARFLEVSNASALPGFKTYDLQITSETDWANASLQIDLTQGSIYQDPAGSDLAPNPTTFGVFPSLEFDTYVTANSKMTSIAGDADGVGESRFDTRQLDITWSGPAGNDVGTLVIGRVTLSDDAVGDLKFTVTGDRNELEGSSTFTVGDLSNTGSSSIPASAAADFTNDGMADILWQNTLTGRSSVWQMNRTNFVGSTDIQSQPGPGWHAVGTGDFTGDGKADILWRNTRDGRNLIAAMNGTTIQSNISIERSRGRAWKVAGVSDFTGDGQVDILWRNARNGRNRVWEMDGTTFRVSTSIKAVNNRSWVIAGAGDFTGDGKADILWRNTRNGRNSVWEMDGTDFLSNTALKRVKKQKWQIAGIADYTGDGKADILWRDTRKGKNVVWQMNGTDYQDKLVIRAQTRRGWQPAGTLLGLWE